MATAILSAVSQPPTVATVTPQPSVTSHAAPQPSHASGSATMTVTMADEAVATSKSSETATAAPAVATEASSSTAMPDMTPVTNMITSVTNMTSVTGDAKAPLADVGATDMTTMVPPHLATSPGYGFPGDRITATLAATHQQALDQQMLELSMHGQHQQLSTAEKGSVAHLGHLHAALHDPLSSLAAPLTTAARPPLPSIILPLASLEADTLRDKDNRSDDGGDSPTTITASSSPQHAAKIGEGTVTESPAVDEEGDSTLDGSPSPSGSLLSNVGGRRSRRVRQPTLKSLEVGEGRCACIP